MLTLNIDSRLHGNKHATIGTDYECYESIPEFLNVIEYIENQCGELKYERLYDFVWTVNTRRIQWYVRTIYTQRKGISRGLYRPQVG